MATPGQSDCTTQNAVIVLLLVASVGVAAALAFQPLQGSPAKKRAFIDVQRARLRAQGLAPTVAAPASRSGFRTVATVANKKAG
jgi:hypothetical protein